MEIYECREPEQITLEVEGRIDTNTSPKLQERILNAFQKTEKVILDLQKNDYISSAGLRTLLIGEKTAQAKEKHFCIKNICPDVMEVLCMTGFDKILNII